MISKGRPLIQKARYNIGFLMHGARNVGGGEYSIFFLIKNLRKDIFRPIVFYAHENEIIHKIKEEGIETIKIPLHNIITSIYREEIKYNPISLCVYLGHLVKAVFQIRKAIKKNKIDLLHPHDNLSKIIGGIAAKITGIKVVAHCRDGLRNNVVGKILKMTYIYLTDRVIAVSEKTAEFLRDIDNYSSKNVQVIYNGVDLNIFDPEGYDNHTKEELKISDDYFVLGIIGVLERYKGHIYLFEAMEKLRLSGVNNFKCLVVGDGREKEDLVRFAKDKDLLEEIIFLGYRKDIPDLLKAMDILVIPSIEQEAFPRVAIEAMAMKVPVVCTDFGGLPEAIVNGETGIIVPIKDINALYKGIRYLMELPEIRKRMGEAGRKRVEERFNIENNVGKTEGLYLNLLK